MSKEDGGAAFACAAENGHQEGMSLRDYFAGQALSGMLGVNVPGGNFDWDHLSKSAYKYADALISERKKE